MVLRGKNDRASVMITEKGKRGSERGNIGPASREEAFTALLCSCITKYGFHQM
jgi:hypothetical protein